MKDSSCAERSSFGRGCTLSAKLLPLAVLFLLGTAPLRAGIEKTFPGGFVVCVFDRPATITNHGSKLVVQVQDPRTCRWSGLPSKDDPADRQWSRTLVETDSSTDEVDSEGVLTIKGPVAIRFSNFKGGEIDVEFSALPKRIKRLPHGP